MPRSSNTERVRRRQVLVHLLETGKAATQDEIVSRLRRSGFSVTQATVSRDLEELGAVRAHGAYALPSSNGPPAGTATRVLTEFVLDAQASANLVVVRTFPGMANAVAAMIDAAHVDGVLGTVAGDDTVLVVARDGSSGRAVAKRIRVLHGA
jgi:transcriptional regulator of arginine metabolism